MLTNEPVPRAGCAAVDGPAAQDAKAPVWKGSCLEFLCGPEPTLEQQRRWYRWCAYYCREHDICGRTNPPGPF